MPSIIGSPTVQSYNPATVLNIAGHVFSDVEFLDMRNFTERNHNCQVNYLDAKDAEYAVFLEEGEVVATSKYYKKPVTKEIGGVVYDGIMTERVGRDGVKTIENLKRNMLTTIQVGKDGKVLSVAEPFEAKIIKFATKMFRKIKV